MLIKRSSILLALLISTAGVISVLVNAKTVRAAQITQRSVTISSAQESAITSQDFQFTVPTANTIGSIVFEYCSNSPLFIIPCTPGAGVDVSAAGLDTQTGNTGFSIDTADTTAAKLVITRPPAAGLSLPSSYTFSNVTNPPTVGTVFVRISTYATADGTGPLTDSGAVAYAILNTFSVDAFVPPFIKICVGITVAPDCSSIIGDSIDLGILSSSRANYAQSQFAAATNSVTGYSIYSLGTTMTSGNNQIPRLTLPSASFPGSGQFGINLRANLAPPIGQDPVGLGTAAPAANYNVPNRFMYNDGDLIAQAAMNTNYSRMTVSYLVNVSGGQAPGVYATTVTYLAVGQF